MRLKKGSAEAKTFMAKLRAKRATKNKINPKPKRIDDLLLLDEIKGRAKKVGSKPINKAEIKAAIQMVVMDAIDKGHTNPKELSEYMKSNVFKKAVDNYILMFDELTKESAKKLGSTLKLTPKETRLGATENDFKKQSKSYHKDTKSHNVNIKVVSGINGIIINDIKSKYDILTKWNKVLENLNIELKNETKRNKPIIKVDIFRVKNIIKDIKKDISSLQRKVK